MDVESLLKVFRAASSQNAQEVKLVEKRLQELNRVPGFYSYITQVVVNLDDDLAARFQAALFLKNNVDTIWRKNRSPEHFSIDDNEKAEIRSTLLSRFDEAHDQINLQIAVIIGKIARLDCPISWPQLIPTLSDAITTSSEDSLMHNRALLVLYHVVKVLVSKRLAADKRVFHELSGRVFNPLCAIWRSHFEKAATSYAHASSGLLCLKILRYVVNFGFVKHHEVFDVRRFLDETSEWMKRVFHSAITCTDEPLSGKLMKITLLMIKMIIDLQEMNPLDFVYWLPVWLELCFSFVFSDEVQGLHLTELKIRSVNFLKLTLMSEDYKVCRTEIKPAPELAQQASEIKNSFFCADRVHRMCYILIKQYLALTDENLEHWHDEPEIYATVDDSHNWRECLTPAAESFYVALVHECWADLRVVVPSWITAVGQPLDYANRQAVLERDALLVALGLAASDLYEEIDFDSLFLNIFLSELSTRSNSEGHNIIRRRILWTCGKWANVKFSKQLRPQLYGTLIDNIAENKDIVLRLTACAAFKSAIDDFEFDLDQFRPWIESSVAALVHLMKSCNEPDAQALKSDCINLLGGMCTILPAALDVALTSHVYLLEEGLDLWLALLENCASPMPSPLLDLFRFMPNLMTMQSENLKMCCEIVKAYCAYGSIDYFNLWLPQFGETVLSSIEEMRNEGKSTFLKTVEMVIRCYKAPAVRPMSGVVSWCVRKLLENEEAAAILVLCCSVVSLVSVHDINQIYEAMTSISEPKIVQFLKYWMQNIALTSHDMERRKLFALGFSAWLTLNSPSVDEVFSDLLYNLSEILRDICSEENGTFVDNLVTYDFGAPLLGNGDGATSENEHDRRMQSIRDADPIYVMPLQNVIVNSLNQCQQNRGVERFGQLWSSVDEEIVVSLRRMIHF